MSTIEEILAAERKKVVVDVNALSEFLYSAEEVPKIIKLFAKPGLPYDFNSFNKSRVDLIKESLRTYPPYLQSLDLSENNVLAYFMRIVLQGPSSIHSAMFVKCIEFLGTETQQEEWYKKAVTYQIVGCYAQTELGHGSDVQNLQTTATYVMESDTFIMNTPTISAAKYWPGDLGITCSHALVFAQLIIHGKNHGVHSFIVPVRDTTTLETLPGIEVGDIGPKIGFSTKDNGYLIMHNVVIPKRNMLRKFVSVNKKGEIKTKGDPKVSYATMMVIRQTISCIAPRVYAMPIIISARYSLFRKQFLNANKQQVPVIDYQTQKDKIISRVAEYYAVISGGNAIKAISDRNLELVMQKNDFSIMNESHVCLCLGKALYSQICYDGMEICRRACGGHGFSHYSGLPNILSQYASNLTYQGENTILYLQVTRYLLKNYKYALTKKKNLGESVKYFLQFENITENKVDPNREDWAKWTLNDIRIILAQSVYHCISLVTEKMLNKSQGVSDLDVWNKVAGIEIKRTGMAHAIFYTYQNFRKAVEKDVHAPNRQILTDLCLLFGLNMILTHSAAVAEGGFILPVHISSLMRLKEHLLDKIRPQLAGLLDSFLVPENLIRSALAHGDPYQNYLQLARKCEINDKISQSAFFVKDNIQRVIRKHQQPKL